MDLNLGQEFMKNLLMIAYHFPPIRVSSGIQRTLKFANYLLDHDWKAQVLTVSPKAYDSVGDDQMHEIPTEIVVKRAFALDTARHLSIKGRYLGWMALPDRWVSWCLGGTLSGLQLIYQYRPKIIWSTYPIATAHLLGLILHRITGIPWVADFRDSMTEDEYPANLTQRNIYRWIERQTVAHCSRAIFTTPGAIRMYAKRYPDIPSSRWALIPNGYDEENFTRAEHSEAYTQALAGKGEQIILLHSGILYPSERDPSQFFMAMAELKQAGKIRSGQFKVILRATGHDDLHSQLIAQNGLQDIVFLEPNVAYETALAEMLTVDGLLIFQASNCNHQIPAKIYEYLRARRPILAFTDPEGDTAKVLSDAGLSGIAALDNKDAIASLISEFIENIHDHKNAIASDDVINGHSRQARTQLLVEILNQIA
jgi:glycosyltransferase involved in cell wall biosynthesis